MDRTPRGTHCCFYEGRTLIPRASWSTAASLDFFKAVLSEEVAEVETRAQEGGFRSEAWLAAAAAGAGAAA